VSEFEWSNPKCAICGEPFSSHPMVLEDGFKHYFWWSAGEPVAYLYSFAIDPVTGSPKP
jgi:hypothetical protein